MNRYRKMMGFQDEVVISESGFPAAVKIGPRAVRWRVEEVQAWISERDRVTYTPPP